MRTWIMGVFGVILVVAAGVLAMQQARPTPTLEGALTDATKDLLKTVPHLRGARITPDTFDNKIVVVTFFASWCPPCRKEFGDLQELYTRHHQAGVEIIAINLFEDFDNFSNDARLAAFLDKTQPPFTVVKGNAAISQQFGTITRIPSLFIFDRQGRRALQFAHERDAQQQTLDVATLQQVIAKLL